jgi:hypothetical protein
MCTIHIESAARGDKLREEAVEAEEAALEENRGARLALQLSFYACRSSLTGGTLELRFDEDVVDSSVSTGPLKTEADAPSTPALTIPWHT